MRRLAGESSTPESHPADSRMATHYTYRQNLYVAQQQQQQPPAPIPPQWQTSPIPARETHPKDRSRSPTKGSLQITKRMRRMQAETSEMRRSQANMREMRRKGDDSSLYHMLPLSISQHSLLHAILAVSARDLLCLHRHHQDCQHGYQQIKERQKLVLSFYHHYHRFATLYKDDLLRPPSTETANLAHSNAFLMNVLVVADPASTSYSSSTSNSWVTRKAKDNIDAAFSWIKVQAIHQTILEPYWKFVPSTFWYSVFVDDHHQQKDDQEQQEPSVNTTTGIRKIIIDHLAIICAIEQTSTTTPERNVYLSAYKNLCSILTTPIPRTSRTPSAQIFGSYIKFMIELNAHFVNLLRSKDEPALLMFSIWLNRMRSIVGNKYVTSLKGAIPAATPAVKFSYTLYKAPTCKMSIIENRAQCPRTSYAL
ncbi:uncharacterized protein An07g07620 [Aspergillus niger]|uniref:Contig An07c0220, genomic contig n=2 Tax=Aspergillus niger TaxID=5061 RepID=A5AAW3_ASPNC|nr:uncharacterized protein An07g07620 [Aspergillus niger]CAK39578.1 unnamed protein product [Aspergillus niger]